MVPAGGTTPLLSFRLSRLLDVTDIPHAFTFAALQGVQGIAWALPTAIIPIVALERLGGALEASVFFFAVSFVGLFGNMAGPTLIDWIGRRRTFLLGGLLVVLSGITFPMDGVVALVIGMSCYVLGFLCLDLCFTVAFMERIPRRAFTRFEPLRMMFMGAGFIIGPTLGVQLNLEIALWAPFGLMAALGLVNSVYALQKKLIDEPVGGPRERRRSNPLQFVPRYARQPRLRLAWFLAVLRSSWWTMYFIYAPIYCVEYGLGEGWAGIILSVASTFMLLVPLWGRLGRRTGLRALLAAGYLGTGVLSILVAPVADWPSLGVAVLLAAALAASLIDAAGNSLFLRAVHPHERPQMASVFSTYREIGKIGPPGLCAALLVVFPLPVVFVAAGTLAVIGAWYTRFVPRRY